MELQTCSQRVRIPVGFEENEEQTLDSLHWPHRAYSIPAQSNALGPQPALILCVLRKRRTHPNDRQAPSKTPSAAFPHRTNAWSFSEPNLAFTRNGLLALISFGNG